MPEFESRHANLAMIVIMGELLVKLQDAKLLTSDQASSVLRDAFIKLEEVGTEDAKKAMEVIGHYWGQK